MKLFDWKRIFLSVPLAFLGTIEASAVRSLPNCGEANVACNVGTSLKLLVTDLLFWPLMVLQQIFYGDSTNYEKIFINGGVAAVILWYYLLLSIPNARPFIAFVMAAGALIYGYQKYVY